ncbi:copper homeostasis periplasmic binding protein CopC [Novosphingobium olei]|uniref:Copper homeostasis periplasmic binding protein CopC n=1 Tax=Novosphingobium olei TaxID=2728851 RepID=A0A7Y0GB52_9SPHN|nr:copper homeostasis periplasmic binding protein CopC [Novosphingobium olei]NML95750.1 copper homeostasis periplasmic binding protein CopC [Novosphingobium olei]
MKPFRYFAATTAVFGLAFALPAQAHPRLVSSSPVTAANAINVRIITLNFNESILPQMSGLEIIMTGIPGMAGHHPSMKVTGIKVAASADRKSLTARLPRRLSAGTYDVSWHAVGSDTHRVTGKVSFTAR